MMPSNSSEQRKRNSEKRLASLGITSAEELPATQEEASVQLRSAREVAQRILIYTYLNCVAMEPSLRQEVMRFLIFEKLWDCATSEEQALFHKPQLSEEEITSILWRGESIILLLWAIEKIEVLGLPESEVDPNSFFPLLPGFFESTTEFIETATIRDVSEILDQYDFSFRLTWALTQGNAQAENTQLNTTVAYEQYTTLSWLINADV